MPERIRVRITIEFDELPQNREKLKERLMKAFSFSYLDKSLDLENDALAHLSRNFQIIEKV